MTVEPETFVDPVSEPDAYQKMLLGLLGDDDPAEVQSGTSGRIRALVEEAGVDLTTRPDATEWSVLLCIAHISDAEVVVSGRYRWILAHEQPDIVPYDQDLWVDRLHPMDREVGPLLELFEPLRRANLALWERTPVEERARFGVHRERGPESYELTFRLLAGHDRFHLAQAERALAAVRATRGR